MREGIVSFQEHLLLRILVALVFFTLSQGSGSDINALLAIKQHLNSSALADWTGSNPCNWTGIQCGGSSNNVVNLSLQDLNLTGTLDPVIGNLTSLREINLTRNFLSGPIPSELRNCRGLRLLDLSENSFDGQISSLFDLKYLEVLNLAENMLNDSIPPTVGSLESLSVLNLTRNTALFGEIPSELGNCTSLRSVDLSRNKFSGPIPPSLFHLMRLQMLNLGQNKFNGSLEYLESTAFALEYLGLNGNRLSGQIPGFVSNLSELNVLKLSRNNFTGTIPSSLSNLTKLKTLLLERNNLSGGIPAEVGQLSALTALVMNWNALGGPIPVKLFDCRNLTSLNLHHNQLNSGIPREIGNLIFLKNLQLNNNELTGTIPVELANCSLLDHLNLRMNYISGALPGELAALRNLTRMYLSDNQLTGVIPYQFSSMVLLEYLVLSHNSLIGQIPDNFSIACRLLNLELADNQLTGPIPSTLGTLRSLQSLDLSRNQLSGVVDRVATQDGDSNGSQLQSILLYDNNFTGSLATNWSWMNNLLIVDLHGNQLVGQIPAVIGRLFQVEIIDLSSNQLFGAIPPDLGSCAYLTALNLSFNRLVDEIPAAIAKSWQLNVNVVVDFSSNNLSGQIPQSLNLGNLKLNVSNNNLSGSIPPLLQNLGPSFFVGNPSLCGPPLASTCTQIVARDEKKSAADKRIVIGVVLGCWATGILAAIFCFARRGKPCIVLNRRRGVQVEGIENSTSSLRHFGAWFGDTCSNEEANNKPPKLNPTLSDLSNATGGFSADYMIGDGGFGSVYKGVLCDGSVVAIKKLTVDGCQGEREFIAELETLGSIRHHNLVRLFGYCSNSSERLLVYEYMPNNSLDVWLYSRTEGMEPLPWQTRMIIAKDVARALTFLHHICIPKIVHRDLKASNILLDANFKARLGDFGLARNLNTYDSHISTSVAGSLGYIAPEYAQSWRVTTRGDVFSFGVVLLELLSGKRPAGGAYKPIHGGNLVGWVHYLFLTNQISALFFDASLDSVEGSDIEKELMAALEIAVRCTHEDPSKRPAMLEVLRSLEEVL